MTEPYRFTMRGANEELVKRLKVLAVARDLEMSDIFNEMARFYLDNYKLDGVPVGELKLFYDADRVLRRVS